MSRRVLLAVLPLLGACTRNPVSGRPELTIMSAAELTGVLGHEIGQVAACHAARRVRRAAPLALVTALCAGITGLVSPAVGGLLGGVGELANSALLAPYSRDQEREADRVGQEIVAGAGYDPAAFSTFLDRLEREEALHRDQARAWSFFATPPPTPERVATTARAAAHLTRPASAPIATSDADFRAHLDGLPVCPSARDGVC